jgi:sensor histidine kinase YesM
MQATVSARSVYDLRSLLLLSAVIASGFLAIWIGLAGWQPLPALASNFVISFGLAFLIGGLCWIAVPWAAHGIWKQNGFLRWTGLLGTMLVCAAAGTAAVSWLVFVTGFIRLDSPWAIFREAIRSALPVTVIVGVLVTLFEGARERLRTAELQLRTQQWERERAEKLAAEAQLSVLTARVQPHFLFNTLNSISALVRENPKQAEQTIERLASLLRASLDGAGAVPLDRELTLVRDYLEIQQVRFGGRLRYHLAVDPESRAAVPPFAIQSVVENSLKHVAGSREEGVAVEIRTRRSGSDLLVEVTDDGPGFAPDCLKAGHGLDTLQERLRAMYGGGAGVEFSRTPGRMTVRLRVPAA